MKANKIILIILSFILAVPAVNSAHDKYSQEYLQGKKHYSLTKPVAEKIAQRVIKSALKKETGSKFKVKFYGYTTSSMKKGIFKYLEITGEDLKVDGVPVPYFNMRSLTDYNYIDYKQKPPVFKSDMTFAYNMKLSEDSVNTALQNSKYKKTINRVNKIASPLFVVSGVRVKLLDNRMYIIVDYNFPIIKTSKDRSFISSCDFSFVNREIRAKNVKIDSVYGNIPLDKVANLINILNPLEFTLDLINIEDCKGNIENVNIVDNIIKVDGKIYIKKGE